LGIFTFNGIPDRGCPSSPALLPEKVLWFYSNFLLGEGSRCTGSLCAFSLSQVKKCKKSMSISLLPLPPYPRFVRINTCIMNNPWKQNYEAYTKADHKVWRTLFNRQMELLPCVASKDYLQGLELIRFNGRHVPDFVKTNKVLKKLTGWQLHEVPGIIPVKEFFTLLNQKKFSATTWLRQMSQLDYLEEPDMFHDVFGHAPMLTNTNFTNFMSGLGRIAEKHLNNPKAMEMLGRIYWFTVEFGMIREYEEKKIYGAGILSSHGETKSCMGPDTVLVPFDVTEILNSPYRTDVFQDKYFAIQSYEQLYYSVQEIDFVLNKLLAGSQKRVA